MRYYLQNMSWPEVKERISQFPVALVPIGSTEQHGHHLPLGTDIFLAEELAGRVSEETGAIVYPSLNFGYSWVWRDCPGTVSLRQETLQAAMADIVKSAERYGIRMLIFINGHEANGSAMKYVVRDIQDQTAVKVMGMFYPGIREIRESCMETEDWNGMFHACEFETSLMLSAREPLVDMTLAQEEYPETPAYYGMDNTALGDIGKTGVFGNPVPATKEKGDLMFDAFAKRIASVIWSYMK